MPRALATSPSMSSAGGERSAEGEGVGCISRGMAAVVGGGGGSGGGSGGEGEGVGRSSRGRRAVVLSGKAVWQGRAAVHVRLLADCLDAAEFVGGGSQDDVGLGEEERDQRVGERPGLEFHFSKSELQLVYGGGAVVVVPETEHYRSLAVSQVWRGDRALEIGVFVCVCARAGACVFACARVRFCERVRVCVHIIQPITAVQRDSCA